MAIRKNSGHLHLLLFFPAVSSRAWENSAKRATIRAAL